MSNPDIDTDDKYDNDFYVYKNKKVYMHGIYQISLGTSAMPIAVIEHMDGSFDMVDCKALSKIQIIGE